MILAALAFFGCRSSAPQGQGIDAGQDAGMDRRDAQAFDYYCAPDAMGGGVCPINFCGQAKSMAALTPNQSPMSGADSTCNSGRVCVVGPALATGDGFQLVCTDPQAGAQLFGAACSTNPAQAMRCAADSLCIAAPDFPNAPFCSSLCRNDADCPTSAICLEHQTPPAPNGSPAVIGMCVPLTKIAGTACMKESDCPAGMGCDLYGQRTGYRICRAGGPKSLGEACTASTDCRSGACYDRTFHVSGGTNRTFCSGTCRASSDCGADQICTRLVVSNNGTPDDALDDLVSGYCQSLFPPVATNDCGADSDCVGRQDGSDTCDLAHGLCYKKAAVPGSACTRDTDCGIGATCTTGVRFPNGYCQLFGCSPDATSGVDACPGSRSTCAQRGPDQPIWACYEGCTAVVDAGPACSRVSEGYVCAAASGATPNVCLGSGGS
jgi:hypothetical protein